MNLKEYILKYLNDNNIKNYNINDIYVIIAHTLNISKNKIILNLDNSSYFNMINITDINTLKTNLNDYYIRYTPLQYIIGKWSFFKEEYIVNKNVLVPRADSEILVETAIKYINENKFASLIDMCTGSGAIGISISKNSDIQNVTLCDISKEALVVTKKNIEKNRANKCKILHTDLFSKVNPLEKVDIIVSNPPYIKSKDITSLDNYVKNEPILALDGGEDGIYIYRKIIKEASNYLRSEGYLLFEIGYNQKEEIIEIIEKSKFKYIECIKDLGLNDRVVVCRFHQI